MSGQGPTIPKLFPEEIINDLKKSGLEPSDMQIRVMDSSEKAACNCGMAARGFVMPYFNFKGLSLDYYRLKIMNPESENGAKYKQPRRTSNHLYYPPNFLQSLTSWNNKHPNHKLLIITEGEKKAACCVKNGIPAVALSGVDSWRNKTIELPVDTELTATKKGIKAKLPTSHIRNTDTDTMTLAVGFDNLLDLIDKNRLKVVIIYDSDNLGELKPEVQRACTALAYELRYFGVYTDSIKSLRLPNVYGVASAATSSGLTIDSQDHDLPKTGLDDYIVARGAAPLIAELLKVYDDISAFPRHPNIISFLNTRLNAATDRKTLSQISYVLICELDARGMRFKDKSSGSPYYFDRETSRLMPVYIATKQGESWHETAFGTFMYQNFSLTSADYRVLQHLASQYTGEPPVTVVTPRRVRCLITENEDPYNPNGIAIQVSNDRYIAVSPDPKKPVELLTNGSKGIMFVQDDRIKPFQLDYDKTLDLFDELISEAPPLDCQWMKVLEKTNLGRILDPKDLYTNGEDKSQKTPTEEEAYQMRRYYALLCYINPYLHRWRGLQIPAELMLGEAGSGKTSLIELRLIILNGDPNLPGAPRDIKDWYTTLGNSGGLIAFDNVNFTNRSIKQEISDDICRLITEPDPHIEVRKLYTTFGLQRIPVDATFAFTAIQQPFQNQDLFQRAAIFELVIGEGTLPEGKWAEAIIDEYGGREAWMAHELVFLHRFLRQANAEPEAGGWDPKFPTENRLAHLEQCLKIASRVFGLDDPSHPIGSTIKLSQHKAFTEADWVYAGLQRWAGEMRAEGRLNERVLASDIANWAVRDEEVGNNPILTNTKKLGRYLQMHQHMLRETVGLIQLGKQQNVQRYKLLSEEGIKVYNALGTNLEKENDGRS
jgi:hypothetical protein